MAQIKFYNSDCIKQMEKMASENTKVNVILTSPPYNSSRETCSKKVGRLNNGDSRYDEYKDSMTEGEYSDWCVDLFNHFDMILKENGVILWNTSYGNTNPNSMWQSLLYILTKTDFMIADTMVWEKKNCDPISASSNALSRKCEFVFVICRKDEFRTYQSNKKVVKVSPKGQKYYESIYNIIKADNNDGSCGLNKATFSSELVLKLLKIYAREGDVVFDPFMGTGTTAIGCEKYGNLICMGTEMSKAQVEYSNERLDKYRRRREYEMETLW